MVYLDYNATTPLAPEALDAMLPWLKGDFGNASSTHRAGRLARQAIEHARAQVAQWLDADPGCVVFTSGGTEADNLAIHGLLPNAGTVAVGATEHPAILQAARARAGETLKVIGVDADGVTDMAALDEVMALPGPALVSVMWANNETGVIQDVQAMAARVRARGGVFHTDAVQAAGKLPVSFRASGVHALSVSAHKIYGPKGAGALLVEAGLGLESQLQGGAHEGGRRAGTENVAGIVGFGVAATLAQQQLEQRRRHYAAMRDRLEAGLDRMAGIVIHGRNAARVASTSDFSVPGYHSEALLLELDSRGFGVSSGSACSSGTGKASHVLTAMGVPEEVAHGAVRVSVGCDTSADDIDAFLRALQELMTLRERMGGLLG